MSILLREKPVTNSTRRRIRFWLLCARGCVCTKNGLSPGNGMMGNSTGCSAVELGG